MEIIQSKDKNDKNEEKEVAYQRPMVTIKYVNILIMITERNERKRKIFEEIKAENISDLVKSIIIPLQVAH